MLSYIVLCCGLLYVQAQENCSIREVIRITDKLLEENFGNCHCSQTHSCLCLPTSGNGCELSCFVEGFQRMKETLAVNERVKEKIGKIHRSLRILQKKKCANFHSCKEPCHPTTTGNVTEFLTRVRTTFQEGEKKKGGKK